MPLPRERARGRSTPITTRSSTPLWRNLGSRFTNWVAGFVLDKPKGFYLSSFRCMSAFVVREITRYRGPLPYVDGLILQVTQDIDRLLVRHLPRAVGRSNYTMRRLLRLWLSMFVNFSVMPLRLSTLTGFALSLIGDGRQRHGDHRGAVFAPPAGWASLMAAVLLLSGVQLVILGIVGGISRPPLPDGQPEAAIGHQDSDAPLARRDDARGDRPHAAAARAGMRAGRWRFIMSASSARSCSASSGRSPSNRVPINSPTVMAPNSSTR